MDNHDIETVLDNYLIVALWSSVDPETEEPLDNDFSIYDCSESFRQSSLEDIVNFICLVGFEDMAEYLQDNSLEQLGHDFWLTRNGHGAGFWDRGLGQLGERLTKHAKWFGSVDLFVYNGEITN